VPRITTTAICDTAREAFGIKELRAGQLQAVTALLHDQDTLAVMPTGYGKSAIYQIAGTLKPGATIVVSPLIALQRDQVESLGETDAGGAAEINSTLGRPARSTPTIRRSVGPGGTASRPRRSSTMRRRISICAASSKPLARSKKPTLSGSPRLSPRMMSRSILPTSATKPS
jgi:Lhr-like helicase